MLQSIRDRLTGPIVWFVVGLISIPFAFWGIESFRTGDADPTVAEVGDDKITQNQLRQSYEQRYQQYRSLLGESFRAEDFDEARFRQLVLDDMIQESVLRQHAGDAGFRAGDATLREFLKSVPAFQKDGAFSSETYRELLARQNLQTDAYEARLRESLAIDQLRVGVQGTAFATPIAAWDIYRLANQKRAITVVPVPSGRYLGEVQVSQERIAERYARDQKQYLSPERMKLAYVKLDRTTLSPAEAPAAEVLKALYDAEKESRFTTPEERRARHILVATGNDADAAQRKAQELRTQLDGGADFAQLARSASDDPGSKEQGGDLGWVRKGAMVPAFEEALFQMQAGTVSGPVQTDFGWHLIRLDEIKAVQTRGFEDAEVQAELLELYRAREREKRFQDLSAKLEQLAFENASIEPVAEGLGVEVQKTDWFTRGTGEGIASQDAVRQVAFAPEIINDGENSKPITVSPDVVVVVRKDDYEAARQLSLDEVRERIRVQLAGEDAAQKAQAAADALLAEVKAGKALAQAATAAGLAVQFEGEAGRDLQVVDGPILEAAFSAPRPAPGAVQALRVDTGAGYAVLAISSVTDPERPQDAAALAEAETRARERLAGAEFAAYRKAIENAVKVERVREAQAADTTPEPTEP